MARLIISVEIWFTVALLVLSPNNLILARRRHGLARADVCGYESCSTGKPDLINVHIVPHTHNDVGWLKTVDQYYYGHKNDIQRAGVQYILDNVITALLENPERKFSYVETAFFWRWWQEQNDDVKNNVRMLVNQGTLYAGHRCKNALEIPARKQWHEHGPYCEVRQSGTMPGSLRSGKQSHENLPVEIWNFVFTGKTVRVKKGLFMNDIFGNSAVVLGKDSKRRLTMVNGAWSQNDEATTHYSSIIENFAWGLRRLNDSFGKCGRPTVGWQVDPFGHSKQHASLIAQIGFDGVFFGRVDYQDKEARVANRTMEMIWEASSSLGDASDILAGVLPNGYSPPVGFCFDSLCQDDPIMDDPRLFDYNADSKVKSFIEEMENQAMSYASNHLIATMGEDFNYQNADMWFKNLDKLIKYTNAQQANGSKVNLIYSTPACYVYALNQAKLSWPTKSDDFFPYASDPHAYWTGYFTSRAALKKFERDASAFLTTCKQVAAIAGNGPPAQERIAALRESVGVAQHHDAVAGTEKQAVAYDYALRLDQGVKACQEVVAEGLAKILKNVSQVDPGSILFCDLLNISQCYVTENHNKVAVVMWNSLGRGVQQYVHIPVPDGNYMVTDSGGKEVPFQVTPLFKNILEIPGRMSTATQELVFYVTLPPTGYTAYNVYRTVTDDSAHRAKVKQNVDDDVVFQNSFLSASFDVDFGILKSLTNAETGETILVNQTYQYYAGFAGNNSVDELRASGAYIFRPNCTGMASNCRAQLLGNGTYEVVQGPLVQEIRQYFAPWVSQVVRLYANSRLLEFEWQIGPIPVEYVLCACYHMSGFRHFAYKVQVLCDDIGKEMVSVFSTDLASNKLFYTDSNGREVMQRMRNFRPTFKLNLTEPLSSNYYPVTNRIYMRDETKATQLTVLTDRAQGGSSLADGQLELMIHRRLLYDDAKGVGEALNEPGYGEGLVVRGKHYLSFSKTAAAVNITRLAAQELYWKPSFAFIPLDKGAALKPAKSSKAVDAFSLPVNIHLLSLENWTNGSLLIRLEHLFEKNEDPVLSQPATVDLQQVLTGFKIASVQEVTLDGNVLFTSINRLKWNKKSTSKTPERQRAFLQGYNVTLNAMEIRTFQVELSNKTPT